MNTTRLEAFSDGVIAIIITIMVLEIKDQPFNAGEYLATGHAFLSYILSFIYVGIYWNNHHHLLHAADKVDGKILWANLHLLFWLSLFPCVTDWMAEDHFQTRSVALYGVVLFMAGLAYYMLSRALIAQHGRASTLAKAIGKDTKGVISMTLYAIAIPLAFFTAEISLLLYVAVACMWIIPDKRIERNLA